MTNWQLTPPFPPQTFTSSSTTTDDSDTRTDVSVIPFIRESDIEFVGYNLRPTRQHWYYFDDKEMSHFISRPNIIVLDTNKNFGDILFNTPKESVIVAGGTARVLLNETNQLSNNTTLYVSQFSSPRANIRTGNTVVGTLTNLLGNVVSYQHFTGFVRGGSNTRNVILGLDAPTVDGYYVGNVITITTGSAAGQSSNVIAYNAASRIANVSPPFSVSPSINDIYSIGDSRKSYAASVKQSHYTTNQGFIAGALHIPDPNANTMYSFRTGDRIFRILDNPLNQLVTTDGDKAYTSRSDYRYTTNGLRIEETQVINRVTTTNTVTVTTTVFDPIAQSFFVDGAVYREGIFVPSIDLFFKNRGENLPIQLQIRPMVEGFPASTYVIPYAETTLQPNQVKVSDLPSTANANTATRFTFPSPVYLPPDQEYAFVILTNDYGYDLWVSEVGQNEVGTGRWVSEQPYLGSMFKSQSGRTFTALQNEDVMFVINKCTFANTGQVVFNEKKSANARLPFLANSSTYTSNAAYDFFHLQSDFNEIPGTKVNFSYRSTSNTTSILDPVYIPFTPDKNTIINERKVLFGPEHKSSFNVQMQLSTNNPDVSPIIYYNRQNLVIIENIINNMEISNTLIVIANTGAGYTQQNTNLVFSVSSTGVRASGTPVVNTSTGAIESVVITNPASGYFGDISCNVVSSDTTITANAIIVVSSETDKSGGPAIARYIGKTVTLTDGFDAGDMRVYVTAVKPATSNVQVYYKVRNSLDPEPMDDKYWTKMVQKGKDLVFSTTNNPIEYEFVPSLTANSITYTSSSATYTTFNEMKIKIVLASSSTLLQDVPQLYDVRAIALPTDRF